VANSSPVTLITSENASWTEVASRFAQVSAIRSTPTTTLAAIGLENRWDTLPRNPGSAR
jgi:hypothetical protein